MHARGGRGNGEAGRDGEALPQGAVGSARAELRPSSVAQPGGERALVRRIRVPGPAVSTRRHHTSPMLSFFLLPEVQTAPLPELRPVRELGLLPALHPSPSQESD